MSLLLALIRKRLAETDAGGGETRLVPTRSELIELLRTFLPETADEARLFKDIDTHIGKVVDLGFLRRMGSTASTSEASYEVRRIIRAFIDAQWLSDLDDRLQTYRASTDMDSRLRNLTIEEYHAEKHAYLASQRP